MDIQLPTLRHLTSRFGIAALMMVSAATSAQEEFQTHSLESIVSLSPNVMLLLNRSAPSGSEFEQARQAALDILDQMPDARACLAVTPLSGNNLVSMTCGTSHQEIRQNLEAITFADSGAGSLASAWPDVVAYFTSGLNGAAESSSPIDYRCRASAAILISADPVDQGANLDYLATTWRQDLIGASELDAAGVTFGAPASGDTPAIGDYPIQRLRPYAVMPESLNAGLNADLNRAGGKLIGIDRTDRIGKLVLSDLAVHRPGRHQVTSPLVVQDNVAEAILVSASYQMPGGSGGLRATTLLPGSTLDTAPTDVPANALTSTRWQVEQLFPEPDNRHLYSNNPAREVGVSAELLSFSPTGLPESLRTALSLTNDLIAWVRGDRTQELQYGGALADRESPLGGITHSTPVAVPAIPKQSYTDPDYRQFRAQVTASGRRPMIYVQTTHGMLHGFNADTGVEQFGYVPGFMLEQLGKITSPGRGLTLGLDGPVTVADVRDHAAMANNPWRTLLIGTGGRNNSGIYALDVTNPDRFRNNLALDDLLLWEHGAPNEAPVTGYPGGLINPVSVVRVRIPDGGQRFLLITGNGLDPTGEAGGSDFASTILVLDPFTGERFQQLTLADTGGGVTALAAVDVDRDSYVDRVYAADMSGRLWRADWQSETGQFLTNNDSGGLPRPLFVATSSSENVETIGQSIVGTLEAGPVPGKGSGNAFDHGVMIYFGTNANRNSDGMQSIYGVLDPETSATLTRSDLAIRRLEVETTHNRVVRTVVNASDSNPGISESGWAIDLPLDGEQIRTRPTLLFGRLQFETRADPDESADPCNARPMRFLIEVDAISGEANESPIFDLNDDGIRNADDAVADQQIPAGVELAPESAPGTPLQISGPNGDLLIRATLMPDGSIEQINTPIVTRRTAWRRMYFPNPQTGGLRCNNRKKPTFIPAASAASPWLS